MKELRTYDDVVIKEADKGAGVVVLDKTLYVREALRQLNDNNVYQKLDSDPTEDIINHLNVTLVRLVNEGVITKEMADFANPKGTKRGRFYLLSKVHKIGHFMNLRDKLRQTCTIVKDKFCKEWSSVVKCS